MTKRKTDLDVAIDVLEDEIRRDVARLEAKKAALAGLLTIRAQLQTRRNATKEHP
jgi:hypothetical protein